MAIDGIWEDPYGYRVIFDCGRGYLTGNKVMEGGMVFKDVVRVAPGKYRAKYGGMLDQPCTLSVVAKDKLVVRWGKNKEEQLITITPGQKSLRTVRLTAGKKPGVYEIQATVRHKGKTSAESVLFELSL